MARRPAALTAVAAISFAVGCAADLPPEATGITTGLTGTTGVGGSTGEDSDSDGPIKLDVADGMGTAGDAETGCRGIDFLFVIDNSGSMADEQQALIASFPGFIDGMEAALSKHQATDFHVMVVDTDGAGPPDPAPYCATECFQGADVCSDGTHCALVLDNECYKVCSIDPGASCDAGNVPCEEAMACQDPCDCMVGAGRVDDATGGPCGLAGPDRYMTAADGDLAATFSCLAEVGTEGDGDELVATALQNAVAAENNAAGSCNEAFVRKDTILVVTLITDEEDDKSGGDPATWKQAVLDARGGDESGLVMLGLIGDTGSPGAVCNDTLADPSPRLTELVTSFEHHVLGSVCEPSYDGFFEQAIDLIEFTCDTFEPPG